MVSASRVRPLTSEQVLTCGRCGGQRQKNGRDRKGRVRDWFCDTCKRVDPVFCRSAS